MGIITSLLDTDLYKFTQAQVAFSQFRSADVRYEFKCRNEAIWTEQKVERIKRELEEWSSLKLTKDEIDYLKSLNFFNDFYLEFLSRYSPNYEDVFVRLENGELKITVQGPWHHTIFWEVPVLAIVNEVYFSDSDNKDQLFFNGMDNLKTGKSYFEKIKFAEFGTRRRFSKQWHSIVLSYLKLHYRDNLVGTSNLYFAKQFGLKPIGTMAHEFLQVGQVLSPQLEDFQKFMLDSWVKQYRGKLAVALTDVVGSHAFFKDFDLYFSKVFDGLRHDSGCPYVWGKYAIEHFEKMGLNPKDKTLVFSDGLNPAKAANLHNTFSPHTNVLFGIGTNLTNNMNSHKDEIKPLQIVMKVVECNGRPVAKISDSPGKGMCEDQQFVDELNGLFGDKYSVFNEGVTDNMYKVQRWSEDRVEKNETNQGRSSSS